MKSDTTNNWIVCRICLKQPDEEMRTIFDENDEKDLTLLILRCGGVPIKRFDHYPDKICSRCYKYLCVADKFRETCQRSHQHLSKFIAPVEMDNMQDPIEPDISLTLDDHEVTLKLEPLEGHHAIEKESNNEIKRELNEDMVEAFEPMHVEVPGGLIDQSIEGCSESDCEFLEEFENASNSSEDEELALRKKPKRTKTPTARTNSKSKTGKDSANMEQNYMKRAAASLKPKKIPKKLIPKEPSEPKKKVSKKTKDTLYICDICGNLYPSQSRLTEHIKLHKGIKPYECEICGHAFAQTQQLARHMNTHTGRRPYKCNYCPAAFADVSTRNKHHRIHTNERPYVCDVCGKSFTYTNTLKFHKMTHTGEKPHVCDICGKGFQQAYKMRLHRVVHEKKGLKVPTANKAVGLKAELLEI